MSAKIVEMVLNENSETKILIETSEDQQSGGMGHAGIDDIKNKIIEVADSTFTGAMEIISYSSNVLLTEMGKIQTKPDTAQIEFGIKINGEGKAMLASGGMEVNYKVTLSWKNN